MFDPEKVDQWMAGGSSDPEEMVVNASDYDSLLHLYRELKSRSVDMNRPWPEFKKDMRSEGKSS